MKVLGINKGAMAVILVVTLLTSVAAGATGVFAAKQKSTKIEVKVVGWSPSAVDMVYRVYANGAGHVIGKKTINFATGGIDTTLEFFTANVKFDAVGLHKDQRMGVCITDVDNDEVRCSYPTKYKPGEKPSVTVQFYTEHAHILE